jgi:hypothetical protein
MCRGYAAMDNRLKIGPANFDLPDDSDSDDEILNFCPFSTSSYGLSNQHPNQPPSESGPNPLGTHLASQNTVVPSIPGDPETETASLPTTPTPFADFPSSQTHQWIVPAQWDRNKNIHPTIPHARLTEWRRPGPSFPRLFNLILLATFKTGRL